MKFETKFDGLIHKKFKALRKLIPTLQVSNSKWIKGYMSTFYISIDEKLDFISTPILGDVPKEIDILGKDALLNAMHYYIQNTEPTFTQIEDLDSISSLVGGFSWKYTTEGFSFWNTLYRDILKSEYNK